MTGLVHAAARELWAASLASDDRVLVIGASGWFGRTAVALMQGLLNPTMLIASAPKEISVDGRTSLCVAWDSKAVADFAPTVVVDCAFLTRDLVGGMPLDEYVARNRALTATMLQASALESVRRVITISSGAAVFPHDALNGTVEENPYGYLKREAENELSALVTERGISAVVARAWSVSGAFVQKPRSYALTDMVLQAEEGAIAISAPMAVYRRYVSVEDLLSVALADSRSGAAVLDSGGPLVEMEDLAATVAAVVNPAALITRTPRLNAPANRYYADSVIWDAACARVGFAHADLPEQVRVAWAGLRLTPRG